MRAVDQQSKSNSPARAENGTASDSREAVPRPAELASEQSAMQMSAQKHQNAAGVLIKPATVDFNGDSLYDSGLIISQAPMAVNQTRFPPHNQRKHQAQQITKQTQNSSAHPSPAAQYLASTYSVGSGRGNSNNR